MLHPNVRLYHLFSNELKLPTQKAGELVTALDEKVQGVVDNAVSKYKSILKEDMLKMEMNLRGELLKMEISLRDEIKNSKVDTIKWMVGIFLALALMILGQYFK